MAVCMKKYVVLIVFIIIGIGVIIIKQNEKIYDGKAMVIENTSFTKLKVKISGEKKNAYIYSNVFQKGDILKVKYKKTNGKIVITQVTDFSDNKKNLVHNISSDVTLNKYFDKINITTNSFPIQFIHILPIKIKNQYYQTIEANEFINIKYHLTDTFMLPITKDDLIMINSKEEIEILGIENIKENGSKNNLSFSKEGSNFTFRGIGSGTYSVKIRFKDGNILNYIFI